jgi:cytochrome c
MIIVLTAAGLLALAALAAPEEKNAGAQAFEKRCGGCHGLDQAKEGPPLRGVFERKAGVSPGFPYSDSLKASGLTWTAANLDKWLRDPSALAPKTDMAFRLDDAAERERIIGYLRQAK